MLQFLFPAIRLRSRRPGGGIFTASLFPHSVSPPDGSLCGTLRAWNRKPFRLIAGKYNFDCAPIPRQIIAKQLP